MKKLISIILICLLFSVFLVGCGNKEAEQTTPLATMGNPWSTWETIEEAEAAAGFEFNLPETIADSYTALEIQTMNSSLIEVTYFDEDFEVCVRKQKGEGQDISGDYNTYNFSEETTFNGAAITTCYNADNNAIKQLISYNGYSWSIIAPNGFWGDSNQDFINEICN